MRLRLYIGAFFVGKTVVRLASWWLSRGLACCRRRGPDNTSTEVHVSSGGTSSLTSSSGKGLRYESGDGLWMKSTGPTRLLR